MAFCHLCSQIQADLLHKTNINTFALGIGSGVDQAELALIASDPSHVYTVDNFAALASIQQALSLTACNGESLNYCLTTL